MKGSLKSEWAMVEAFVALFDEAGLRRLWREAPDGMRVAQQLLRLAFSAGRATAPDRTVKAMKARLRRVLVAVEAGDSDVREPSDVRGDLANDPCADDSDA